MIEQFGWSDTWAQAFMPFVHRGFTPGRIVAQHRDGYRVATDDGELRAKAAGRLFNEAEESGHPAVGDWVALSPNPAEGDATIHAILPRRTEFVRRAADSDQRPQVVAAALQSGARPVVVLTKSDLSDDPQGQAAEIAAVAGDCLVVVVSVRDGLGLDVLLAQVGRGETCVLIGSSGVGKSTLVNALLGEDRMATDAIREGDDQGRHTTSHRELFLLAHGGLVLDTPGIREVGLIDADEGLSAVFDDIEQLAQDCRFNDCSHLSEPGCAVRAALESGALDPLRWENFEKLGQELAATEKKSDRLAADAERRRLAGAQKIYRAAKRDSRGEH